ncbi:uncharacterized protein TNCV_1535401 [Trichonephila clavipes]|uniref:Uncharacterized protein n=1 Tax=Trichonephila clavipes TaxID=2585209 RepID=A0A8X6UW07_TRICX|nr:uncharacterized protein TNCV_1535401 [Trichonephila clavipes]
MHSENCKANHFGKSGSMEVSESLHGLRCTKCLENGDSRAYKPVNETQPYGDTDAEIDKLQRYYGLNIRNNTDSINSIKRAIWATYFHKISTDAYPKHGLCPTNEDTLSEYNRTITPAKHIFGLLEDLDAKNGFIAPPLVSAYLLISFMTH